MSSRVLKLAAVGLLLLHLALGWSIRSPGITLGGDDSSYLLLGRELGQGRYASVWLAGAPPHGQYPPGYPALLAVSGASAPGRAARGVTLNLLLSAAALGGFTLLCWRRSPGATLGALGIAAVNLSVLKTASAVSSEPLFTLLMYLALWAAVARPGRWPLAALAAIAAALTRSIGVAVIAGLLLDWAWQRRWRPASVLAVAALLTLGPWFVRAATVPQQLAGESYVGDALYVPRAVSAPAGGVTLPQLARMVARRVIVNSARYVGGTVPTVLAVPTVPGTAIDNVAWLILLLGLGAVGVIATGRQQAVLPLVVGCYFAILLVWPYVLWRFIAPLVPLLAFFVLDGARRLFERASRTAATVAVAGLAGILMVSGLLQTRVKIAEQSHCDRSRPYAASGCFTPVQDAFLATVADAERLAPAAAVFLTPKPAAVHYLTGHSAVDDLHAARLGSDRLNEYLRGHDVRFVLVSRVHLHQDAIAAALLPRCREWGLVVNREAEGAVLLRRREGSDTTASPCEVLGRIDLQSP